MICHAYVTPPLTPKSLVEAVLRPNKKGTVTVPYIRTTDGFAFPPDLLTR